MTIVTGSIKLASGQPYIGQVLFRPQSTPLADGSNLVATADIVAATDNTGALNQALEPGYYQVCVGSTSKWLKISVPNDGLAHNILDLIVGAIGSSGLYTWTPAGGVPIATDTILGAVKLSIPEGDAIALAFNDGVQRSPANGTFRFKNGTVLQLWGQSTGLWHTISLVGQAGQLQLEYGPGEV